MRVSLALLCLLVSVPAWAQLPLNVPFQSGFTYNCNGVGSHSLTARDRQGAEAPGNVWNASIASAGGYLGRSYMDFFWWDWDSSGLPNASVQSVPAGYFGDASDCEPGGGYLDEPYYLKWRWRTNTAILAYPDIHPPNGLPDGDTQMKFFIWGAFSADGRDRVIVMIYAGNAQGNAGACGGVEATQTCIEVCAGVSSSCAQAVFDNGEWVFLQVGWQWGQEGTAFQRIYINNGVEGSPTAQNTTFDDAGCPTHPSDWWCFPTSLAGLFYIGDIDNTGSAVRDNANVQSMDWSLSTDFDPNWAPSEDTPTPGPPVLRMLIRPELLALAPIGVFLRKRVKA